MLALVMLINRSGSMVLPFLGIYMTSHLGFSIQSAGIVLSFFGLGSVLGSWLGGLITDKIGEYKVQALSLFLSVPLFCMLPVFKTEIGLSAIIFLQSLISETFRPANTVAVTRYAKPENLTRAFSLNRMAINLGFSFGPAMGGFLSAISYDFLFYANALGAFLAGITYIFFFRNRNYVVKPKVVVRKSVNTISPYKDVKFIVFCAGNLIFSLCFLQLLNTLPIFYEKQAMLSQQQIGFILGYSGFVIVLFEMLLVQIAEKKFSLKFALSVGTLLCGISFLMLGFGQSIAVLVISMTILCIGEIWALPFMTTVTALKSTEQSKGAYMGLLGVSTAIAFIITPYLGTQIAERFGFQILWIGTGVVLVLNAIAFYYIIPWMIGNKKSFGNDEHNDENDWSDNKIGSNDNSKISPQLSTIENQP